MIVTFLDSSLGKLADHQKTLRKLLMRKSANATLIFAILETIEEEADLLTALYKDEKPFAKEIRSIGKMAADALGKLEPGRKHDPSAPTIAISDDDNFGFFLSCIPMKGYVVAQMFAGVLFLKTRTARPRVVSTEAWAEICRIVGKMAAALQKIMPTFETVERQTAVGTVRTAVAVKANPFGL